MLKPIPMTNSIEHARNDFPVLNTQMNGKRLAFLDSAASAQKPQQVIDAMNAVLEGGYSNIHRGLYKISQDLTEQYEAVRGKVARFIGAPSDKNIVFTRNTTEAVNLFAQSWGRAHLKAGDEIILTEMEHHANIVPWQLLRDEIGIEIRVVPVLEDGTLDYAAYESLLSPKTKMVGCVQISNALGTVNNISKIIELAKNYNPEIRVLIDGTQAVVHSVINVSALGCDAFVFTGHKLYGPNGIGVLYGTSELLESMPPYQGGGDMIERVTFEKTVYKEPPFRFEAGTPPITEVIGLGAAVDYLVDIGVDNIAAPEAELLSYGLDQLQNIGGVTLYGTGPDRAAIMSFTCEWAHHSDIGMIFDQMGVAVRAGHHCCMPLMQRYGVDGTIRTSIGLYSNKDDIDQMIEALNKAKDMFG